MKNCMKKNRKYADLWKKKNIGEVDWVFFKFYYLQIYVWMNKSKKKVHYYFGMAAVQLNIIRQVGLQTMDTQVGSGDDLGYQSLAVNDWRQKKG